jgi:hypothetical protein
MPSGTAPCAAVMVADPTRANPPRISGFPPPAKMWKGGRRAHTRTHQLRAPSETSTDLQVPVQPVTVLRKSLVGDALHRLCRQLQVLLTVLSLLKWTILAQACAKAKYTGYDGTWGRYYVFEHIRAGAISRHRPECVWTWRNVSNQSSLHGRCTCGLEAGGDGLLQRADGRRIVPHLSQHRLQP